MTPNAQGALEKLYQRGVTDGMEIVLELLLGKPSAGGIPFSGRLNVSAQKWAMFALTEIKATKERDDETIHS